MKSHAYAHADTKNVINANEMKENWKTILKKVLSWNMFIPAASRER